MPKALKSLAMANPHKSEQTRACGGKTKVKSVPKGVNKKLRGNVGTRVLFLTRISQIAQIFWEERHLAAPFLLFFPANSKRQRRDRISPGRKPWVANK